VRATILLAMAVCGGVFGAGPARAQAPATPRPTTTPIEHLIVVVGENLTFDNIFATYRPSPICCPGGS